jgi:penicillin-binding protein 1A
MAHRRPPARRRLRPYQVGLILLALLILIPFTITFIRGLGLVRAYELRQPLTGATVLDRRGETIAVIGSRNRSYVPIQQIPVQLQNAVIAVEDARFRRHPGIDPIGIARALLTNLRTGRVTQGASTITQQLAKNLFLTPSRTLRRKLEEAVLALVLEARYSKDEILELYLNSAYFGHGATGVQAAALTYFGKPVSELTLAESALLVGVLRGPAIYDPYRHPDAARARRQVVLTRMAEEGYISQKEAGKAAGQPIELERRSPAQAPYFVDWITSELLTRYTPNLVYRGGLRVHTTLDLEVQRAAESAMVAQPNQGAIVVVDPKDGGILAMVGGRSYTASQFNRAISAYRQPGSAMKPFVYAVAFEQGYGMADAIFIDQPITIAGYSPANFRNEYLWTTVTLKHAVVESLNSIAVQLLNRVGIDPVFRLAQQSGLPLKPEDRTLALALGGIKGVTPLQLAEAYNVFAAGGVHRPVYAIAKVVTDDGRVLEEYTNGPGRRLLSAESTYLVTNMLEDVILNGTGKAAAIGPGYPAAGKTGTSDDRTNAWFAGYTPDMTAVVYIGNDDNSPLGTTGGLAAAPVWGDMMHRILATRKSVARGRFPAPPGIVAGIPIDWVTGGLATENCPTDQIEWDAFREWSTPETVCQLHPGPGLRPRQESQPSQPSQPVQPTQPAPTEPSLPGIVLPTPPGSVLEPTPGSETPSLPLSLPWPAQPPPQSQPPVAPLDLPFPSSVPGPFPTAGVAQP